MSEDPSNSYKLEHVLGVKGQITRIAAAARKAGKLQQFVEIMKEAVRRLRTNPDGWGDPERHLAADGLLCRGILRPVVFRYVIYEQVRSVVLLEVRLFADFG